MNICFLVRSLSYGGAQRQLIYLANGLRAKGHRITILTFYRHGELENEIKNSDVSLICLNKQGRWDIFAVCIKLFRYLKNIKPNILHGYLPSANLLAVFLKPLFPSLKIVWGIRSSNMNLSKYNWLAKLEFKLCCYLAPYADLMIANSRIGARMHKEFYRLTKEIKVIFNGIDVKRFSPNEQIRAEMRSRLSINASEKLIGLIARIDPMKGHEFFIKAAAKIICDYNNVKFICIGNGEKKYIEKLQGIANRLNISNRLIWLQAENKIEQFYNSLDIFVLPSIYGEGFPNAACEAMASALPCILTDVGDMKLISNGVMQIISPGNVDALYVAIRKYIEMDDRELAEIGYLGRQVIREKFSIPQLVNITERALIDLYVRHQ